MAFGTCILQQRLRRQFSLREIQLILFNNIFTTISMFLRTTYANDFQQEENWAVN